MSDLLAANLTSPRIYLLANPDKPGAKTVLAELESFASERCHVLGARAGLDPGPAVTAGAQRIVVLGGDGTLIGVARALGSDQIPLIGVNMGKFGFLTEFSTRELKAEFDRAVSDQALVESRGVLEVTVIQGGGVRHQSLAINDCVLQAGPPFRPITLGVSINGSYLTEVRGDGLIVCTPSGSTGHNLSAGGPIVQPGVDAIVVTPLCAHSLTHRPIVIERNSVIEVRAAVVNAGTTAIVDGQVSCPLEQGDVASIRRYTRDFLLVRNPAHAPWHKLVTKLHWGRAPNYD